MSFQTPHYSVTNLLEWAASGHLQLPDFQRSYKWDDERIRSLLVTILRGHPMGVLMALEAGGDQVRFKPKPITGVTGASQAPGLLLLDGQQRTTSLFQALSGDGVVDTEDERKKKLQRRYFLDIEKSLGDARDQDEAVRSVPADGRITENFGKDVVTDLSTTELQQQQGIMPFVELFRPNGPMTWLIGYMNAKGPEHAAARGEVMARFNGQVLAGINQYRIPAILLPAQTSKEAVATVFEKVNTGGLPLNVFELLTATFAGDAAYYAEHSTDFRLAEDWDTTAAVIGHHSVLAGFQNTDFLQAVSVLVTLAKRQRDLAAGKPKPTATSARKEDILAMDLADYLPWSSQLRDALPWVAHFLNGEHIHTAGNLPYRAQVTALAVIRVLLGEDIDLYAVRARVRQWFWCGVLGEQYGGTIETKVARDAEQMPAWAVAAKTGATAPVPDTVSRAQFAESRLLSLRTKNAAAYKGVYALLMAQDKPCVDWKFHQVIDKASYESLKIDVHHVFPRKWCLDNGIAPAYRESIINKTPLGKKTNIQLGGQSPKEYMRKLDGNGLTPDQVDDIVRTHAIDPATLRSGDFDGYFTARRQALVGLIEGAMGKHVNRDWDGEDQRPAEGPEAFEPEPDDQEDGVPAEGDEED
ncbi:GmrSD restriction endonuclease domain-containing protein [Actinophytocola sp. KF-1]